MSKYKNFTQEETGNLLSQFLVNSWSYSKVSTFSRNEKAFEMQYIYNVHSKRSATTIAGEAYHASLKYFFEEYKNGIVVDLPKLEQCAFIYIDEVKANVWKIQKTTPTVDECKIKANKTVSVLLKNFIGEVDTYILDVKKIVEVEIKSSEWLTINGVEIPLPCTSIIDLVVETNEGKIAIVDHKSKVAFTDDKDVALTIGVQAITYVNCFESRTEMKVDEVWFIENKSSENRDKSSQLKCFKVEVDNNTRALYESILYEPLKRMIEAVNNPDYVYLINYNDNFTDKAELFDFWAKTMLGEIDDFNVEPSKKELVKKRLRKIKDSNINAVPPSVIKKFKESAALFISYDLSTTNMTIQEKIEHVLRVFNTPAKVAYTLDGYSSNSFLLEVSAGVPIKSIVAKKLDIANAIDVSSVRIPENLLVYNGKSYVCIEVIKKRDKDLNFEPSELNGHKLPLGKNNLGNTIYWDLNNQSTPHMLVCGSTGSGKSVFLISTLEYAMLAGITNIIILDPKYEFLKYKNSGVSVVNDVEDIEKTMEGLVNSMNQMVKNGEKQTTLIIFDEFADAVQNAKSGNALKIYETVSDGVSAKGIAKTKTICTGEKKSLEENLRMILQKGRSVGFRVVSATQRASVKVITGDAKVNYPIQVCFKVPKEVDSKVVLDESGAECLAGQGDGLIKSPEYGEIVRFQAFYIS